MPFNGSGVANRLYNWVNDANAGINITASRMDGDSDDFITMFNTAFCRDGQAAATGDFNLGAHLLRNIGNATLATDALALGQLQSGAPLYGGTAGGTANAITISLSPAITAYSAGQVYSFKASAANTGAATVNINSVGVATIKRLDGTDLQSGDIQNGQTCQIEYDGTNFQLLNRFASSATPSGLLLNIQVITASGTYTPTAGTVTAYAEILAAGGGNQSVASTTGGNVGGSGAGGSGAYALLKLSSPSAQSITIGAGVSGGTGGSTVFAGTTCTGGGAGGLAAATTGYATAVGGAGGTVSGGSPLISVAGQGGGSVAVSGSAGSPAYIGMAGDGGSTKFGHGGRGVFFITNTSTGGNSKAASGYGSGAPGLVSYAYGVGQGPTAGQPGIAVIYEFS